jgi:uncharacterized SAM-dependent methyltransferase
MRLVSRWSQRVLVRALGREFEFEVGESVVTEHSVKHTPQSFTLLCRGAGLRVHDKWSDSHHAYALYLLAKAS